LLPLAGLVSPVRWLNPRALKGEDERFGWQLNTITHLSKRHDRYKTKAESKACIPVEVVGKERERDENEKDIPPSVKEEETE